MADLDDQNAAGNLPAATYARQMTRLEERKATLEAMPQRKAETRYETTEDDPLVRDHWASLDYESRGAFLRAWGLVAIVWGHDVLRHVPVGPDGYRHRRHGGSVRDSRLGGIMKVSEPDIDRRVNETEWELWDKRVVRVDGVLFLAEPSAGAVVWAMRERFGSDAWPRLP